MWSCGLKENAKVLNYGDLDYAKCSMFSGKLTQACLRSS